MDYHSTRKMNGPSTELNCTDVTVCKGSETQKYTVKETKHDQSVRKDAFSGRTPVTTERASDDVCARWTG